MILFLFLSVIYRFQKKCAGETGRPLSLDPYTGLLRYLNQNHLILATKEFTAVIPRVGIDLCVLNFFKVNGIGELY